MNKKLFFIFNPYSGKAQLKNKLLNILQIFVKEGYLVEIYPTQKKGDAKEVIQNRGIGFERIVVSGGDGTLNIDKESRPKLGYIPTGTSNDFASNLKISKDMIKAAKIAVSGSEFLCDIGNFDKKRFTYVAAFGAFTDVAYETPQMNKNYLGQLAYLFEGIKKLHSIKSYKVRINAKEHLLNGDYIFGMISNSDYIAGLKHSKLNTALNDGVFEVFLIKNPKNIIQFQKMISDLMMQNLSSEMFDVFKTDKITFEFEKKVPWTIDGEYGGTVNKATVSVEKNAVNFISGF